MHNDSTSANISSKAYITDSHRPTLHLALAHRQVPQLELVASPLFRLNVDWRYRRKRDIPVSCQTLAISDGTQREYAASFLPESVITAVHNDALAQLNHLVASLECELVHICWNGVLPDDDDWRGEAAGLIELFPDTVMVGGTLHDGASVVDGPRIFGFGRGLDCPDRGRPLSDPGYFAGMFKARSVSAVSTAHCVIKRAFLLRALPTLLSENVPLHMLAAWLGALAAEEGTRIVFSPFMRARASVIPEDQSTEIARAHFLSRFWPLFPDSRFYSTHLGLASEVAYVQVSRSERDRHLRQLQSRTLPYPDWLRCLLRRRQTAYPLPHNPASIAIITTVYEKTNIELLEVLAESVIRQSVKPDEWLIVVHGPLSAGSLDHIKTKAAHSWDASVVVEPTPLGIAGALRKGLQAAKSDYVVPVDADDVITDDALQILVNSIANLGEPDLLYSDEDLLIGGGPSHPYLRPTFDPILNLDSSYIWHLCAIKRTRAISLNLYTDAETTWCHDWDTVMRIWNAGGTIEHVPEILYHWRRHSGSTTNREASDPRSLHSIRHILQRQIASLKKPDLYFVADWPMNRGARELYIARKSQDLPQLVWAGDISCREADRCDEDAILVFCRTDVVIRSDQVFVEVARLLELHPAVGAVGGLVRDKQEMVVDACYMKNSAGMLESPWIHESAAEGAPYALALKTQRVASTGESLAFFRISALKRAGVWPSNAKAVSAHSLRRVCGRLTLDNWLIAFSPLVYARATRAHGSEPSERAFRNARVDGGRGLVSYGISRNYRLTDR